MTYYLDSSAFVSWFDPRSAHCRVVLAWREKNLPVTMASNHLIQSEARHYFRRLTHDYASVARHAYAQAESARHFDWQTLNVLKVMQQADDFSRQNANKLQCGFWDLCHVMAARELEAPFVTCDSLQGEAAELAGLNVTVLG